MDTRASTATLGSMARRNDPRIAVAVIRVSTEKQHEGPEAQRASIEAWAAREGVSVVAWHVETGVSGATPIDKRPALLAALSALREHGAGVLVAAKRDRFARDVVIAATLERLVVRQGATLATADGVGIGGGPEAQLMRTMVDAFAQYERALIRTRTRAALQAKRARGERVGTAPLGMRVADDGVRLVADDVEQLTVQRVRQLAAEGLSQRAIVAQLDAEGAPCRGRRHHLSTVQRILARAAA